MREFISFFKFFYQLQRRSLCMLIILLLCAAVFEAVGFDQGQEGRPKGGLGAARRKVVAGHVPLAKGCLEPERDPLPDARGVDHDVGRPPMAKPGQEGMDHGGPARALLKVGCTVVDINILGKIGWPWGPTCNALAVLTLRTQTAGSGVVRGELDLEHGAHGIVAARIGQGCDGVGRLLVLTSDVDGCQVDVIRPG